MTELEVSSEINTSSDGRRIVSENGIIVSLEPCLM